MPPLYPKMRERPAEFRINPASPLYDGLVLACLGYQAWGSTRICDHSLWHNHVSMTGVDAASGWRWDSTLQRFVLRCDGTNDKGEITPFRPSDVPRTIAWWGNQDSTGDGRFRGVITLAAAAGIACQCVYQPETTQDFEVFWRNTDSTRNSYCAIRGYFWEAQVWQHVVCVHQHGKKAKVYGNGTDLGGTDGGASRPGTLREVDYCYLFDSMKSTRYFKGTVADILAWNKYLTASHIAEIADPSNIDLRIGGIPLILPPRRRYWPVVSEQAIPKMVPWHLFQQVSA